MKKHKPKQNLYYYTAQRIDDERIIIPVKPIWMLDFPECPNHIFFLYQNDRDSRYYVVEGLTGMTVSGINSINQKIALETAQSNLELRKDEFNKIVEGFIKKFGVMKDPYVEEGDK